jgi:hypothetical protein
MKIADSRHGQVRGLGHRGVVRWGIAAVATLMLSAVSGQRAEALSLVSPAAAPAAKHIADGPTTQVRGGYGGGGHGGGGGGHGGGGYHGGGGFHGGGHRGGGAVFHGGGFRQGGAVFRGGGYRAAHVIHRGGFRHHGFAFRHHRFHRHFYVAPAYYDYPYSYRRCRVIWTHYGPRRICHYRHWRHHYWRHHHRHHRHWHHRRYY